MSRAFVKESDPLPDAPPEYEIGERPNLVTPAGMQQIAAKLAAIDKQVAANPDLERRDRLARDLRYWKVRQETARLFTPEHPDEVEFGSHVTIKRSGRTQQFQLVGADEADPPSGRINWQSPLAKTILGLRAGETGELGDQQIEVLKVAPLS